MTYEQLQAANATIKTEPIKGKEYANVNERIKAFRMLYPEGFIQTYLLSDENGVCKIHAEAGYYADGKPVILGTGTAFENQGSSFINKTSYIENCETSAVGRALGMCGIGINTSVCSADELQNALANQGETKKPKDQTVQEAPLPEGTVLCPKCGKPVLKTKANGVVLSPQEFLDQYGSCVSCYKAAQGGY